MGTPRDRAGVSTLPVRTAAATAVLLACLLAGLGSRGAPAAESVAERPGPPTAAEAKRWEESFLRSEGDAKAAARAPAGRLRGRRLFSQNRVLSLYGAAGGFGVIGRKSLNGAARKLRRQIRPYRQRSKKPVLGAFDLVAVIATQCGGRRDKCRVRVSDATIKRYLNKISDMNGRLILDIQPGRANVLDEIRHLRPFLRRPNVDVAIDAEWNVGRREHPGQDAGSIQAERINRAIRLIRGIQERNGLPPKLLIIHQFQRRAVRNRSDINTPNEVDVTINFDGIGSPSAKRAGYRTISSLRLFNGFSLFYKLDDNLMSPKAVLRLEPKPNYVMYQ